MRPRTIIVVSAFAFALLFNSCTGKQEVRHSYVFDKLQDSLIYVSVMENQLKLYVSDSIHDYDTISILFPSTGKELPVNPSYYEYHVVKPFRGDSLFEANDSIRVIFRKKNQIIFQPYLIKSIDTVEVSSNLPKLCFANP